MPKDKKISKCSVKRIGIYVARAVCMLGSGLFFECGTSHFVDLIQGLPDFLNSLFKVVIPVLGVLIYTLVASKMRPYKRRDNDLPVLGLVLLMALGSFIDNFMFSLLPIWWSSSASFLDGLGKGLICIAIAGVVTAFDNIVLDAKYEKYDKKDIPLFLIKGFDIKIQIQKLVEKNNSGSTVPEFFYEKVFCGLKKRCLVLTALVAVMLFLIFGGSILLVCFGVV